MMFRRAVVLVSVLSVVPGGAGAESLMDKLRQGSHQVGRAVTQGVNRVDETIDSTVELVQKDPTPEETRAKLDAMTEATLSNLFATNPAALAQFEVSAGYAVFDTRRATVMGVVAGFGKGVAVSRATGARTYMNMGTGGVGLAFGFGGFESQVVILFEDDVHFTRFVTEGVDATAEASGRAGDQKAGEALRFVEGRSIFVLGRDGWRVSASAAGTRYWPAADLN